tara:strand:+ start:415 stop:552 length:138 start_codon:yes stop_codon:yes gene_type:complete
MRAKKYITLGNVALVALLVIEVAWIWFLWRICMVTLDVLTWGGKI